MYTASQAFECSTSHVTQYVREILDFGRQHDISIKIQKLYRGNKTRVFVVVKGDKGKQNLFDRFIETMIG